MLLDKFGKIPTSILSTVKELLADMIFHPREEIKDAILSKFSSILDPSDKSPGDILRLELAVSHSKNLLLGNFNELQSIVRDKPDWIIVGGRFVDIGCEFHVYIGAKLHETTDALDVLKATSRTDHANVAKLLAFHTSDPVFLILDCFGETLDSILHLHRKEDRSIPMLTLLNCIQQAIDAIIFLHQNRIIHRGIMSRVFKCHENTDELLVKLFNFDTAIVAANKKDAYYASTTTGI